MVCTSAATNLRWHGSSKHAIAGQTVVVDTHSENVVFVWKCCVCTTRKWATAVL
jgi:hypothetical protein